MNDINKKSSAFFTHSGCLTGDALMLFVIGSLQGTELVLAQQHVSECPLCADAADGLRMWLKENESEINGIPGGEKTSKIGSTEIPEEIPIVKAHPGNINPLNEFHTRTVMLNDRIKQRLHTHAMLDAAANKRLSYKPFVWLAVAATIILFIGGFGVVWIQNKLDIQKLAQVRADEMLLFESSATPDTLTISIPENKTVLAMRDKKKKETFYQPEQIAVEVTDQEVYSQDMVINPEIVESVPEVRQQEEVTAVQEKAKVSQASKVAPMPTSKNTGAVGYKAQISKEEAVSEPVFTIVEEMPSFPGGEAARNKFLAENIVYPQQATDSGIQGTVYVSFIVDVKGNIQDVKVLRGIGGGCDEEALRVVKLMPRWNPGRQNGKYVRVLFNMPIYYKLNG